MIEVKIKLRVDVRGVKPKNGKLATSGKNAIHRHLKLIYRDLTFGTFLEIGSDNQSVSQREVDFAPNSSALKVDSNQCATLEATLTLSPFKWVGVPHSVDDQEGYKLACQSVLQHLAGVLCGDGLSRTAATHDDFDECEISVEGVEADDFLVAVQATIPNGPGGADWIRDAFKLNGVIYGQHTIDLPLLGFSYKPRLVDSGKLVAFESDVKGVFKAGFNIVEPDTRSIELYSSDHWNSYCRLARSAFDSSTTKSRSSPHVRRFALNVSGPLNTTEKYIRYFYKIHEELSGDENPLWVLKVDGGLDGLTNIIAIRDMVERSEDIRSQPVITCYPLLKGTLSNLGKPSLFVDMLIAAGANIIYPGGAPRTTGDEGAYGIDYDSFGSGVSTYDAFIQRHSGVAIPTIAGGVLPGMLPPYIHKFGAKVSYFFGGGVAAHRKGATTGKAVKNRDDRVLVSSGVGGAELCVGMARDLMVCKTNDDWSRLDRYREIARHFDPEADINDQSSVFQLVAHDDDRVDM